MVFFLMSRIYFDMYDAACEAAVSYCEDETKLNIFGMSEV